MIGYIERANNRPYANLKALPEERPIAASYRAQEETLAGRDRRKVGNNTYLERRDNNCIALVLHGTDVVTFAKDGRLALNTDGFDTRTTLDRINGAIRRYGWRVEGSCRSGWTGHAPKTYREWRVIGADIAYDFYDGITVDAA